MFRRTPLAFFLILSFTSSISFAVQAKQDANISTPETITVVGTPVTGNNTIDTDDIQYRQTNDLEDIFRNQPNVTVGGGFGAAQKIYVRGVEDLNLNVSIDGAVQSGQLFHHQGRLAIEPDLIKTIEIKPGAGTALDGIGALGGSVRFETKSADDLLSYDENFGALLKTGYFSNSDGTRNSATVYGRLNRQWSGMLSIGKNHTSEFEDGNGRELENTGTNQEYGIFKANGEIFTGDELSFSYEKRVDKGQRNVRTHFISAPWNQSSRQQSQRQTGAFNYKYDAQNEILDISLSAYLTENEFSYYQSAESDAASIKTVGTDLRNTSIFGSHEFTYGFEYKKDKARHSNANAEEQSQVYAIYGQDTYRLLSDFTLSYGARFDSYRLDTFDGKSLTEDGLSPNINAQYSVNGAWSLRAGYSSAIRGPQIRQALSIGTVTTHSDLKKEEASNTELTVEYAHAGVFGLLTVFKSDIDNVVSAVGSPGPMGESWYDNVGELETTGFNATLGKSWEDAKLSVTYSHTDPELNGKPLDDSNFGLGTSFGDSLLVDASYHLYDNKIVLGWIGKWVQELGRVPTGYPTKEAYNVHDIYAEWSPSPSNNLTLNLAVNNLFDEYYFDHGTFGYDIGSNSIIGLPEPGRDIRLSVSWRI
ncbi:TonB-dependent receptor domain-containing protein [Vibrio alginolyticus]|uniref:TonB-dependent receptor domain-containing protein n=1 Tax=Vibrio alginolyticus TaxID=663 RepID=UPI002FF3B7F5